jgi:hypothetical protein
MFEGIGSTNQAKGPDEKFSGFVAFFDFKRHEKGCTGGQVGMCTRQNIHSISPLRYSTPETLGAFKGFPDSPSTSED